MSRLDPGAAWLSEESVDDDSRLARERIWIVDPIDGTREFVERNPEYSISIGYCVDGRPVLGAVALPAEQRVICGETPRTLFDLSYRIADGEMKDDERPISLAPLNGLSLPSDLPVSGSDLDMIRSQAEISLYLKENRIDGEIPTDLDGARLLVSRSEWKKGKFNELNEDFRLRPTGSIARKLALTVAGAADLTVSLYPKNEWDICGGAALIASRPGYEIIDLADFSFPRFNRPDVRSYGLVAGPGPLVRQFREYFIRRELKVEKFYS